MPLGVRIGCATTFSLKVPVINFTAWTEVRFRGKALPVPALIGLSTVMHRDTCGFAEEFIMRGLVRVLKSSSSTDIANKYSPIGWSSYDILRQLPKRWSAP